MRTSHFGARQLLVVLVLIEAACSGPPARDEIAKLCYDLQVAKSQGLPIGDAFDFVAPAVVTAIRQPSNSQIVAKFQLTVVPKQQYKDKLSQTLMGDECILYKYDTGWRAEKITGLKSYATQLCSDRIALGSMVLRLCRANVRVAPTTRA